MSSPKNPVALVSPIQIESVTPSIEEGRYPCKGVLGDTFTVQADIFFNRPDVVRAVLKWKKPGEAEYRESKMAPIGNDRWEGSFPLEELGMTAYAIEAWTDPVATWLASLREKKQAGVDVGGDILEGFGHLKDFPLDGLRANTGKPPPPLEEILTYFARPEIDEKVFNRSPRKELARTSEEYRVRVVPTVARTGVWYEMFVRSQGQIPGRSGTFKDAEKRLDDLKALGFDVLYLAPVHPIGITARKGRNENLTAESDDPGCPWAIGSPLGGHTAVDPNLGTLEDFDRFASEAHKKGFHVALDLAIQCSPDHPWVKEHPSWFYRRQDGTIKCAENPPLVYHDIYPLNFESPDWKSLWEELRNVFLFWINHGVKIFRVDNPHTKPLPFWAWLINEINADHPEVVFLAEAFTVPKMMKALSKAGFTQSYTYFIWRNEKWEIEEYLTELTDPLMTSYFFPNFFVTTHDVFPPILHAHNPAAYKMRVLLAATLSPTYGILNGFELLEGDPKPHSQDYANSEKYEYLVRDWNKPGNIKGFIQKLNQIRKENPSLEQFPALKFLKTTNNSLVAFMKWSADKRNRVVVVVNLDPNHEQKGTVTLPLLEFGLPPAGVPVTDLLTGQSYHWNEQNFVELHPDREPAHILRLALPN